VLVNRGSPELAKVLAGWATKFPNKKSVVISQLMGGKASRVDIESTAVAHRTSLIWVIIIGDCPPRANHHHACPALSY
jgi:hypothetical protein